MKNLKLIFQIISLIVLINTIYSHDQDVHKYITWQAWHACQLVKNYHPEIQNSEMDIHFGEWNNGS